MPSNFHERSIGAIFEAVMTDTSGPVTVVNPSRAAIEDLVDVLDRAEDPPATTVLADRDVLKPVFEDFLFASVAADLVAADTLALFTNDELPTTFLVATPESVVAIVQADDRVAGLVTDDEAFVESARERYAATEEGGSRFALRTPPLSRMRETMTEALGEGTRADFEAVLDSIDTARGDGDGIDEVTISLLVAANNQVLLYDVSKWGEDIDLASKATFSRTKIALEETGVIKTEKVPIDVGRPRLRLLLGEEFRGQDPVDVAATVAERRLAEH